MNYSYGQDDGSGRAGSTSSSNSSWPPFLQQNESSQSRYHQQQHQQQMPGPSQWPGQQVYQQQHDWQQRHAPSPYSRSQHLSPMSSAGFSPTSPAFYQQPQQQQQHASGSSSNDDGSFNASRPFADAPTPSSQHSSSNTSNHFPLSPDGGINGSSLMDMNLQGLIRADKMNDFPFQIPSFLGSPAVKPGQDTGVEAHFPFQNNHLFSGVGHGRGSPGVGVGGAGGEGGPNDGFVWSSFGSANQSGSEMLMGSGETGGSGVGRSVWTREEGANGSSNTTNHNNDSQPSPSASTPFNISHWGNTFPDLNRRSSSFGGSGDTMDLDTTSRTRFPPQRPSSANTSVSGDSHIYHTSHSLPPGPSITSFEKLPTAMPTKDLMGLVPSAAVDDPQSPDYANMSQSQFDAQVAYLQQKSGQISSPENPPPKGLYSTSGFDLMAILSKVVTRKNPMIQLGPVDFSCSFLVTDARKFDTPIVYASPTFLTLTGYTEAEIIGRNCRFLQSPDANVSKGSKRTYTDNSAVAHFKKLMEQGKEAQASLINYRKGGIPFINLVTIIPIKDDDDQVLYHVGFQVDLVESPNAILRNIRDGSYQVNYSAPVNQSRQQQLVNPVGVMGGSAGLLRKSMDGSGLSQDVMSVLGNAKSRVGTMGGGDDALLLEWLKICYQTPSDFVHVLSLKGQFLFASEAVKQVLEYEPEDLINKHISDICHPSDVVPIMRELKDSTHTPADGQIAREVNLLFRVRKKHSGMAWLECTGRLYVEPGKGRKAVILSGRERVMHKLDWDIVAASGALKEQDTCLMTLSFEGLLLHASEDLSSKLGFSPDEMVGQHLLEDFVPDVESSQPLPHHSTMISPEVSTPCDTTHSQIRYALEISSRGLPTDPKFTSVTHALQTRLGETINVITSFYAVDSSLLRAEDRKATGLADKSRSQSPTDASMDAELWDGGSATRGRKIVPSTIICSVRVLPDTIEDISTSNDRASHAYGASTDLFDRLDTLRGTGWQYELHQLKNENRRLGEMIRSQSGDVGGAGGSGRSKGKGKASASFALPPPPPPNNKKKRASEADASDPTFEPSRSTKPRMSLDSGSSSFQQNFGSSSSSSSTRMPVPNTTPSSSSSSSLDRPSIPSTMHDSSSFSTNSSSSSSSSFPQQQPPQSSHSIMAQQSILNQGPPPSSYPIPVAPAQQQFQPWKPPTDR